MLRKLLLLVASVFVASTLQAASEHTFTPDTSFVHIDSNLYVVNETMPRFVDEVYVGDIASQGYDVELCYPEFKVLSNKELRQVRQLQASNIVPQDKEIDTHGIIVSPSPAPIGGLDLEQYLLVDRKKGYLSISFCPIVRHEGAWKRILSCQLRVSAKDAANANLPAKARKADAATERWKETSVLSAGKWAKIRVSKEGVYQLTASDIQKMGFSDLAKVKVYGYGGLLQSEKLSFPEPYENLLQTTTTDDLEEVPVYATSDNRLLFWAEGTIRYDWDVKTKKYTHKQNHYSDYSYYFITENNEARCNITELDEEPSSSVKTITDVPFVAVLDNDSYSWYNGGRRMFDAYDFANGTTHSYRLETPGINIDAEGTKDLTISFGAASTLYKTNVNVKANNKSLGSSIEIDKYDSSKESALVTNYSKSDLTALSPSEPNTFTFTSSNKNKARLDYIRINYPRTLELTTQPYSFSPQQSGAVCLKIANANANTRVWRLGQNGSPAVAVPAKLNADGFLEATTNYGGRRYVFFDETATFSTPEFVGEVANQNLHKDFDIQYVIIVPANGKLVGQAERLGQMHKDHDGLSYKVVRADQLYNEFSSGTPDASAYRRYLKMLYDRAGEDESKMPKFCVFMGKAVWDNRFITPEYKNCSFDDYLLTFEADKDVNKVSSVECYVTDDFFGLLDDGEGERTEMERLDVAMGRFVCSTEEEAKLLIDKTERYLKNEDTGSWKNTIVMMGDDGNLNHHMQDCEKVINATLDVAPNLDIQRVYWDRYTWTSSATGYSYPQGTARIRQHMTDGALVFNYSGHGSPTMLSHYKLLQMSDFKEALSPHMALWVLASCEIYPFDNDNNNIAEASLYIPDGGAFAFICASRSVYQDKNNFFNNEYSGYLYSKDASGKTYPIGEALRLAKHKLINNKSGNVDPSINKLKYHCFGDPAIRLAMPTGKVVLDSINGKPVNEITSLEVLSAGGAVKFAGHICDMNNEKLIDTQFNGSVSATIYDCEEEVVCKNNQKEEVEPMVFNERSKCIFKGTTKAEAGKFEFTVFIPRDISYTNKPGRISFYAVNEDKTSEYNGIYEKFCLNGTAEMAEPDVKGPVVIAFINKIDNPDYTITDENPVLIANISDDYGINNAGISLGHDIELILDGNTTNCINLNSYFNYDFGSYQKGQLVYEMKNMERGQHTAQLRVWDVNNNLTTTDVHFIVRSESAEGGKDGYVTATKNPATTDTKFITYYPADAQVQGIVTYEVYDTRGRCVFKQPIPVAEGSSSSSYSWDLTGNDHSPLPAGIYFYRTVINTSNGSKATDAQKLIITRQ